jgi:hypothetical protein
VELYGILRKVVELFGVFRELRVKHPMLGPAVPNLCRALPFGGHRSSKSLRPTKGFTQKLHFCMAPTLVEG